MVFGCALVAQESLRPPYTEDYTTSLNIWPPVIRAIIIMQRLSCSKTPSAVALLLYKKGTINCSICWSICLANVVEISKERLQGYG